MTISWAAQWAAFESKIFESEDSTLKKHKVKWFCNDSFVMQQICKNKFIFDRFGKLFTLHSAVWFEKSTETTIFIKGEKCYTQVYIIIHFFFLHCYTFCCSSYTCITSFLFELYMYNFISVWVIHVKLHFCLSYTCKTSFLFDLYMYNSSPVLVIHSYT